MYLLILIASGYFQSFEFLRPLGVGFVPDLSTECQKPLLLKGKFSDPVIFLTVETAQTYKSSR